jgi:hypothetical protein
MGDFKFVVTRPFVSYYNIMTLTNLKTTLESIALLLHLLLHLRLHLLQIGERKAQIEPI